MKIQIVSWRDPKNPKAGGAEVCLEEITQRLHQKAGYSFDWFAPKFQGASDKDQKNHIQIERFGFFGLIHLTSFLRFFPRWSQTKDFYIEDYHGLSLGLSLFLRKPSVILVHEVAGPIWFQMFKFPVSWIGYYFEKFFLYFMKDCQFVAVSESTKRDLVKYGIPPQNIFLISEGSNLPAVSSPKSRSDRFEHFVFVGRICKMKRIDLLLHAFSELQSYYPECRLILAGSMDPDFEQEYIQIVKTLKLENKIDRPGFISTQQKIEILGNSLALVSCSMHEGFGLVVVEANSQGTPVITFNVPGYRDLVEHGKNGYLVEYPEIKIFSTRMRELILMEPGTYDRLAQNSLDTSSKYSWDRTAEDFDQIILKVSERWKSKLNLNPPTIG